MADKTIKNIVFERFEEQLKDCSLDPTLFSHHAHLRLGWIHINSYGVDKAIQNVCAQIKRFDATHGDETKFHTTITVASIRTVYHFFLKSQAKNFSDFITEFPRLENNFKDLIDTHYGFNLLISEKTRENISSLIYYPTVKLATRS